MLERNSVNMWDVIKKDPVLLEAVYMYLRSEELVNEGELAFFKKMWFCKDFQKETKKRQKSSREQEKQKTKRQKDEDDD